LAGWATFDAHDDTVAASAGMASTLAGPIGLMTLNCRQNFRRRIVTLQLQKHLILVSSKPGAAQKASRASR
jgi:hypothetical protein